MAIGDGENDIEMLELASLGVALSNGAEKTKAVANVIGASNDEDGVADAIYRYAFWSRWTRPTIFWGSISFVPSNGKFTLVSVDSYTESLSFLHMILFIY